MRERTVTAVGVRVTAVGVRVTAVVVGLRARTVTVKPHHRERRTAEKYKEAG